MPQDSEQGQLAEMPSPTARRELNPSFVLWTMLKEQRDNAAKVMTQADTLMMKIEQNLELDALICASLAIKPRMPVTPPAK